MSQQLCYLEKIDKHSSRGEKTYRLYFTEDIDDVIGPEWELPASNVSEPPYEDYISSTYTMTTTRDFTLLTDNEFFTYTDGADGIIALAWENLGAVTHKKIIFKFGDKLEDIEELLYEKQIVFEEE